MIRDRLGEGVTSKKSTASRLVRAFVEQYEHAGETPDLDIIGTGYADSLIFAGPNGARVIEKDKLVQALPGRQAFFKALGHQSTRITFLDETDLDNHYVLYQFGCNSWCALSGRDGDLNLFASSYFLVLLLLHREFFQTEWIPPSRSERQSQMQKPYRWRDFIFGDFAILILLALIKLVFHVLTNTQYGFHRDELQTLDDARSLVWGYVAYPPLAPFIARLALTLFGPSLDGLRFFAALSQSLAMVLAGLMARELGGRRFAQILAALAVAIAPISLAMSTLFEYTGFDYLWGVLLAYLVVRLLKSEDARWWLGIGAVIGIGLMTRYTMAFSIAGLVAGVLLTPARRYLANRWLWAGVALAFLIVLPNLVWQVQHNFISLQFLSSIHARDIAIGRTSDFWIDQFRVSTNPFMLPLWLAGIYFYFFYPNGRRFRLLGWMALVTFLLFWIAQARGYYTGPIYPMLFAGGAVWFEQWFATLVRGRARFAQGVAWALVAVGGAIALALGPYWPVNSPQWQVASGINTDLKEEIGWPELVQTVAGIYNALPTEAKSGTIILAGNYGVAGAIDLFGPAYHLPRAISGVNSYWLRGYGDPPPQTVVVVGFPQRAVALYFGDCAVAGHVTNAYRVKNEETINHPDIFLCRAVRLPWPQLWEQIQSFG